ncbi:hypothetical protein S40288_10633 [Stachybotrys chartarum IBT 40288]|nr:hypothetical protein S40288_10633 [Stachybotrys chartarum IBT 40288]
MARPAHASRLSCGAGGPGTAVGPAGGATVCFYPVGPVVRCLNRQRPFPPSPDSVTLASAAYFEMGSPFGVKWISRFSFAGYARRTLATDWGHLQQPPAYQTRRVPGHIRSRPRLDTSLYGAVSIGHLRD